MSGLDPDSIFKKIYDKLDTQGIDIDTLKDDIASMKVDLAAIRTILES